MSGQALKFTIEQFYGHLLQRKLLCGRCRRCGKIHLPPRPLCDNCRSNDFEPVELPQEGKLLTYTIIHVTSKRFQEMTPYAFGIVEFENGVKLPGIVKDVPLNHMRIGMPLRVDFDLSFATQEWPQWPRYYFKPL